MTSLPPRALGYEVELRRWTPDDVHALDMVISANVGHLRSRMAWIRFEPQPVESCQRTLEVWEREWRDGSDVHFAISRDDVVIGAASLHRRGIRGLTIGYWVDRNHCGQGVATSAARALTDAGFSVADIDWIEIHHDVTNLDRGRVPKKLGFARVDDEERIGDLPPADTGASGPFGG